MFYVSINNCKSRYFITIIYAHTFFKKLDDWKQNESYTLINVYDLMCIKYLKSMLCSYNLIKYNFKLTNVIY